jgi:hypothetical protein
MKFECVDDGFKVANERLERELRDIPVGQAPAAGSSCLAKGSAPVCVYPFAKAMAQHAANLRRELYTQRHALAEESWTQTDALVAFYTGRQSDGCAVDRQAGPKRRK